MLHNHAIRFVFALAAVALAAGCAPSADNVDEIWNSTSLALTDAQTTIAADVALSGSGADLAVEASCEDGGTISFTGSMGSASVLDTVSASFQLDATFHDCQSEGVTINGDLDWDLSTEVGDDVSVRWSWVGSLTYSGQYVGDCDIDMTAEAGVTGSTASLSYEGTICGFDASASLSASAG